MKNIIMILLTLFFFDCNTIKGVRVIQEDNNLLNRKEIKKLIRYHQTEYGVLLSHLFVEPIIMKNNNDIGLLGYTFTNLAKAIHSVKKALKFEDDLYIWNYKDETANQRALLSFERKYGSFFSDKELKELKKSFNKGSDIIGRLY